MLLSLFLALVVCTNLVASEGTCETKDSCSAPNTNDYDVIVVGGGPAGLQASLTLARMLRRVLVIDNEHPRNIIAKSAHNYVYHDGDHPMEIRAKIKNNIREKYGTQVKFSLDIVSSIAGTKNNFFVTCTSKKVHKAKRIILALGVTDILPHEPISYSLMYYKSLFQCPFCHGYEVKGKKLAMLVQNAAMVDHAIILRHLSNDVMVLTNGSAPLEDEHLAKLDKAGIVVDTRRIIDYDLTNDHFLEAVVFENERVLRDVLYTKFKSRQSYLVEQMGLELDPTEFVKVHQMSLETSTPGVYACGDMVSHFHQIAVAISSGLQAGAFCASDLAKDIDTPLAPKRDM